MPRIETDETWERLSDGSTRLVSSRKRTVSDEEIAYEQTSQDIRDALANMDALINKGRLNWTAADTRDAAFLALLAVRRMARRMLWRG